MSRPSDIDDAEWQVRTDLAACYRLVARYGMSDLIYNHITAKVPGKDGQFLINPFGLLYTEVTASCFYTIDWDGNIVRQPDTEFPINRAGFMIHSAIHTKLNLPTHELATRMAQRYAPDGSINFAPMEWPALLRQLDREDPSYKS